jgi:predicted nucleic acid binding AN1-type Zn finger protein
MVIFLLIHLYLFIFISCYLQPHFIHHADSDSVHTGDPLTVSQIALPPGYLRDTVAPNTFAAYLRNLPLRKDKTVYLYSGKPKKNQDAQFAVIAIDCGKKDLQQCADAIIRLRAEYLFKQRKWNAIQFHLTNGDLATYTDWRNGIRPTFNPLNNKITWQQTAAIDTSYMGFRKYLELVFAYAGTISLAKELSPTQEITIGNVFIQAGSPGHAVIIVDVATDIQTGKKIFLLAQSYMPAQDIHILKNPNNPALSPWYADDFDQILITPEWKFNRKDLKKF